ncbi:MAG: hypothetical protein Q7U10_03360 [Thermodesulfovibrionia bacterium]|nr:hypothetical protein [Thermodesulfovibrionia bacterium]
MRDNFSKYEPAVDKRLLVLLSGLVWGVVGVMLCHLAIGWLSQTTGDVAGYFAVSGAILSLLIHHFGFLKLADKNIERISAYDKDKVCIFAFQEWKSYLIIAIMVCMGIILRGSPLPKAYLSIIYIGFGGAMMLSSVRYFHVFFKLLFKK